MFCKNETLYPEISHNMFLAVQEKLGDFGRDAKFGISEVPINLYFEDGTCRTCYPDYLLNTKIIEFNGDYWHANPLFYSEDEIMPFTSENNGNLLVIVRRTSGNMTTREKQPLKNWVIR